MTENKKKERLREIKGLLATFDKTDQRLVIWRMLRESISGDSNGIPWLLDEVGKLIDDETNLLFSPFQ